MEKHSRLMKFARFYIVTHCYTLLLQKSIIQQIAITFLVSRYTPVKEDEQNFYIGKFVQELRAGEVDAFLTRLQAFFAGFPYELNDATEPLSGRFLFGVQTDGAIHRS